MQGNRNISFSYFYYPSAFYIKGMKNNIQVWVRDYLAFYVWGEYENKFKIANEKKFVEKIQIKCYEVALYSMTHSRWYCVIDF